MNDIDNKALAAGLKKFPEKFVGEKETLFGKVPIDSNIFPRICYIDGFREGYKVAHEDVLEWLKQELETLSLYYEKIGHVTGSIGHNDTFGKIEECKKFIKYIESL